MPEIKEGQIWLDTASDAWFRERGMPEKIRRVKVLGRDPNGRWRVQNVGGGRINRVKPATLFAGYKLLPATPANPS